MLLFAYISLTDLSSIAGIVVCIITILGLLYGGIRWFWMLRKEMRGEIANIKIDVTEIRAETNAQSLQLDTVQRDLKAVFHRQDADRVEHTQMLSKIAEVDAKVSGLDAKIDVLLSYHGIDKAKG